MPRIRLLEGPQERLQSVLSRVTTTDQQEVVRVLLQRYASERVKDLPEAFVGPFADELQAVLDGKAPHPADARLDPDHRQPTTIKENAK